MNKLEAKQKALDNYEEWINCTGVIPKGTGYYYECEQVVREAFEFGFNAERTRWIPVSERLPTEKDANINGLVHVWLKDGNCDYEDWQDVARYAEVYQHITHWMPLPEPPQQEIE